MIPDERQAAVNRALEAAFGGPYEDVAALQANDGLSTALAYRIQVAGRPYLLRLVKETMPGVHPAREFALMRQAAEAGFAPRVLYADVADRVMISDFLHVQPAPADGAAQLGALLRRMHALPAPPRTADYLGGLDRVIQRIGGMGIGPTDELLRLYNQALAAYPRDDREWVFSHNDLKPPNTLYDGERFWFVDWEAAFLNDRYVDLVVVANFWGEEVLEAYFGGPPDARQRARFYLMSQIVHVAYAAMFAMVSRLQGVPASLPDYRTFQRGIVAGTVDLGSAEAKLVYAHLHLQQALAGMRAPAFVEALGMMAT